MVDHFPSHGLHAAFHLYKLMCHNSNLFLAVTQLTRVPLYSMLACDEFRYVTIIRYKTIYILIFTNYHSKN